MKTTILLSLAAILGLAVQISAMEKQERYVTLQNKTADILKVSVGIDDALPMDLILLPSQTESILFDQRITRCSVTTQGQITRQSFGIAAYDFAAQITEKLNDFLKVDLAVVIKTPQQSQGFFGGIGSYFTAYEVNVKVTTDELRFTKALKDQKLLDNFIHVKALVEKDPKAPISAPHVLGLDTQATPEMMHVRLTQLSRQWKARRLKAAAEELSFIDKVLAILIKTKTIIDLETRPELAGKAFSHLTGIQQKDQAVRQNFETELGKGLSFLLKKKLIAELRALLLQDN